MAVYAPVTPLQSVSKPVPPTEPIAPPPTVPPAPQEAPVIPTELPESPKKGFKGLLIILILVIVLGALGLGSYFLYATQAKNLKSSINTQIGYFGQVEQNYTNILEIYKTSQQAKPAENNNLLGAKTEVLTAEEAVIKQGEVLGLEDNQALKDYRLISEIYKQALANVNKIDDANQTISSLASALPIKFMLKKQLPLAQSQTFAKDTKAVLTYLDKMNSLDIEGFTMGVDIGVALNEVALRKFDDSSVTNLESKIDNLDKLKTKYLTIDTNGLSDEMKTYHTKVIADFDKLMKIFGEILQGIKLRDANMILNGANSLELESITSSATSLTTVISFWQNNPTIRSLQTVKESWQNYLKEF